MISIHTFNPFLQFKVGDVQYALVCEVAGSEVGTLQCILFLVELVYSGLHVLRMCTFIFHTQCIMGTAMLCANQKGQSGGAEFPKLLFSAGYGESIGGGFGGEALEVEDNILLMLKAAGVEGKLAPSEFLAILLSFSMSDDGSGALSDFSRAGSEEMCSTPILLVCVCCFLCSCTTLTLHLAMTQQCNH